jgi:hypothetical protein
MSYDGLAQFRQDCSADANSTRSNTNCQEKEGRNDGENSSILQSGCTFESREDGDAPMLVDSDIENDAKRKDGDVSNAVDVEVEESSEGSSDKNSDDSSKEIVPQEMKRDVYDWSTDDSSQNDQSADSIDHAQTKLEYTNDKELADSYRRDSAKPYNWSSDESDFDSLVVSSSDQSTSLSV